MSSTTKTKPPVRSAAYYASRHFGEDVNDLDARAGWLLDEITRRQKESKTLIKQFNTTIAGHVRPVFEEAYLAITKPMYRRQTRSFDMLLGVMAPYWAPLLAYALSPFLLTALRTRETMAFVFLVLATVTFFKALFKPTGRGQRMMLALMWIILATSVYTPFAMVAALVPFVYTWHRLAAPLKQKFLSVPTPASPTAAVTVLPREAPDEVFEFGFSEARTVPRRGRLAGANASGGAPVALPDNYATFPGGRLQQGDVILHIGGYDLETAMFTWAMGKGIQPGPQIGKLPLIKSHLDTVNRVFEANRTALLPVLRLAARINTVHSPLSAMSAELDAVRARSNAGRTAADVWRDVYLPEDVITRILANLQLFVENDPAAPSGMLLEGPPGTGKTEIGRRIAKSGGVNFIMTSLADLKAGNVGGSEENVRKLWEQARESAPCILFIDECEDALPDVNSTDADQFAKAITTAFKAQWGGIHDSDRIWVIGATNHPGKIDTAIMSRFRERITIGLPNEDGRRGIFSAQYRTMDIPLEVSDAVIDASQGLSGRDIQTVAMQARRNARLSGAGVMDEHVLAAIRDLRGRDSAEVDASATWDRLVLDDATIEDLQTVCDMLANAEALAAKGITPPRGYLLKGPPGTGKTQIARTIANESGLSFYAPAPSELKGMYVGETTKLVRNVFARARERAPVVLFIDELENLVPVRGSGDKASDDLVNAMLQELDGVTKKEGTVFVLGATNRPDMVDPAILSRLTETVEIGLPDADQRRRILEIQLQGATVHCDDRATLLARLSDMTEGASGRDLRNLVERAQKSAIRRARREGDITTATVSEEDLLSAAR